ncbi:PAAR domain-containing protein [Roseibium salinum]|uniref:PAAR domain-containing protein n=1 Tax=Roseibium salinum TaxID=1604349 RepID=A0ABT3QXQ3_9HYPH|nr:PAAR domain-containing protein [Roseibium sp. DSM 29163]MCX2721716.1 PAAR domain-containing protein [Roseibium sp. DSM 29163]
MKFPAARLTDMHTCPSCAGVPAPIAYKCAYSVLTGKMPQARVTDLCVCLGPPPPVGGDPIVTGAWTVLVEKLPAARMTDLTLKGGAIVSGFPTVLIGTSG